MMDEFGFGLEQVIFKDEFVVYVIRRKFIRRFLFDT